ncbi:MAG: type II secretion system protein [Verrucomicrobia bacterium]|nr:type II secretion system protein [Verrucomicrobiota bacterium]
MKTSRLPFTRCAFTLIELLVVISIIAVLAGLTFSGVAGAMLSAKKVQAKNDMAQIANAVQLYYTEYGKYPILSGTSDLSFGTSASPNDYIISVLRSKISTSVPQSTLDSLNPRQIQFLQPKIITAATATSLTKGAVNSVSGKWCDPWGTQYAIFIDADYAGDIDPSLIGVSATPKPQVSNNKPQSIDIVSGDGYDKSTYLLSWQ